ncbi:hypothetical protein EZJ49_05215 [Bdellovibrio bacteriovorus]|uniref:hypothetical protein n=1 Tax=Bdellovibrio bacteriovorus TaxID=959 RepID=UPI0021CE498E|nr:hypothetical protein [Bdellovibrio bacteriovorus]UXR65650.1 hypothetical protein EZJ49_05215 [Bdellovibrio bacteriovorus]
MKFWIFSALILPFQVLASAPSFQESLAGINSHLKKAAKFEIPAANDKDLYLRMEKALSSENPEQSLLTLANEGDFTTCSAFHSTTVSGLLPMTGLLEIAKKMNADAVAAKSWEQTLKLADLWWNFGNCEMPVITGQIGMLLFKDTLTEMAKLSKENMSDDDRAKLSELKRNIQNWSPSAHLEKDFRFEMVLTGALLLPELKSGKFEFNKEELEESTEEKTLFGFFGLIQLLYPDGHGTFDWNEGAKPVAAVIDQIKGAKNPAVTVGKAVAEQDAKYLKSFYEELKLRDQGVKAAKDLLKDSKANELIATLQKDEELLKAKRELAQNYKDRSAFVMAVLVFRLTTPNFSKSIDKKAQALQNDLVKLIKPL